MDELVELLWDRGTVVVQGQSSRPNTDAGYKYKPAFGDSVVAPHETKEKKMLVNKDASTPAQILQFGSPEPLLDPDFFSLPGIAPSVHHDCDRVGEVDADTDAVPWIDYPILDTSDLCSESVLPSNLNYSNTSLPPFLHPKTVDIQTAVPVNKSGQDDVLCSKKRPPHLHFEGGGLGVGHSNFSHFLRPVALAEATLQSAERLRSNAKTSTSYTESMVIQSPSTLQPPAKPVSLLPKPQMPLPSSHQKVVDTSNHYCDGKHKVLPPCLQAVQRVGLLDREKEREKVKEKEKNVQSVVAPASVCSRNVDSKQKLKRKSLEEDNSIYSDEDVQDESVGLTRSNSSRGTGIKRGRTAEVHNLSERRRRDRINEKMKALQELIPNCNKVDKASMLDEAIEYLKTLQVQVQMMMMMGSGMCIPPMMVPPGLHHMPLAPYPQMGMGMGMGMGMNMGMGYGMGIGDINQQPFIRTVPTTPLRPPLSFMPLLNGAIFPFENGIPPTPSSGPQGSA